MVTRGLGTEVHKKYEADVKESLIKFWLDHLAEDNTLCPQKKSVCILIRSFIVYYIMPI